MDEQARLTAQIIGEQVRTRRVEGGLSVEAVARALGCEAAHLEAAEDGSVRFSPEQIVDLCPILRVVPSWFFKGLSDPN